MKLVKCLSDPDASKLEDRVNRALALDETAQPLQFYYDSDRKIHYAWLSYFDMDPSQNISGGFNAVEEEPLITAEERANVIHLVLRERGITDAMNQYGLPSEDAASFIARYELGTNPEIKAAVLEAIDALDLNGLNDVISRYAPSTSEEEFATLYDVKDLIDQKWRDHALPLIVQLGLNRFAAEAHCDPLEVLSHYCLRLSDLQKAYGFEQKDTVQPQLAKKLGVNLKALERLYFPL